MKYLVLTCGLMAALTVAAQKNTTIEAIGDNVLYRGFENKVIVHTDLPHSDIHLIGANVAMKHGENSGEYIVKPGNKGSVATLHVVTTNGTDNDTLTSVNYEIKVLPVPSVYWGDAKSGETADLSSRKLSIKYDEGEPFPNDFRIISWEISSNDEIVRGMGDDLSSAEKFLKGIDSGEVLMFRLKVLGQDGIARMVGAQWTI